MRTTRAATSTRAPRPARRTGTRPGRLGVRVLAAGGALVLALAAAACGGDDSGSGGGGGQDLKGQTVEVAAVWTGAEQDNFQKVAKAFTDKTGATVTYTPTGDSQSTFLDSKLQGGKPPDVAFLAQHGTLEQFVGKHALKPLDADAVKGLDENFAKIWKDLGSVDGTPYGVYFKVANKSTVWYRAKAFEDAGVEPPKTWDEFVKAMQTVSDSGQVPLAVAGADGWTLTDWFENVYLSQAGPQKYDQLSTHEIPWTDPSVGQALQTLAQLWGKPDLITGGVKGALQTEWEPSVSNVFANPPKAAVAGVVADFVAGVVSSSTKAKVGTDAKFFPFPAVGDQPPLVSGGDCAVMFKDSKAAKALLAYLASPEAAKIWAQAGGFISPNKNLDQSAYPDDTSREIAKNLVDAGENVRFDMSDLAPAAFGGTKGTGEWRDLQDFLAKPTDVAGAQRKLEADAAKAFKS